MHDVFRRHRNHFPALEEAEEAFWGGTAPERDGTYVALKRRLSERLGLTVRLVPVAELPWTLRVFDEARRELLLSEALDHPNRTFQLAHMAGLLEQREAIDAQVARSGLAEPQGVARLRVEIATYFAAALLMPYGAFLAEARASKYDLGHLATRFGVSYEQARHRATTLQRKGAQGAPFFFLRIDKGGNVTKRFGATGFHLALHGGACLRLDVHVSFRTPGRILPQFLEMPDGARFIVVSRTVDRPTWERHAQDNRLAVAMGCAVEHAGEVGDAEPFAGGGARVTAVGINCRIGPRGDCDQRATRR